MIVYVVHGENVKCRAFAPADGGYFGGDLSVEVMRHIDPRFRLVGMDQTHRPPSWYRYEDYSGEVVHIDRVEVEGDVR